MSNMNDTTKSILVVKLLESTKHIKVKASTYITHFAIQMSYSSYTLLLKRMINVLVWFSIAVKRHHDDGNPYKGKHLIGVGLEF